MTQELETPSIETQTFVSDTNEYVIEEIKTNNSFNNRQILNANDISDSSNILVQVENPILADNNQGGDRLILNYDVKIKLESIDNMYKELKMKYEFIADHIQLYTDRTKMSNDYNMNNINVDINEVKIDMDKMSNRLDKICKREMTKISDDSKTIKSLMDKITKIDSYIDQILLEINSLKNITKNVYENNTNMNNMIELLKYFNEQHCIQLSEHRQKFIEQTSLLENEIDQLQIYIQIKAKEFDTLTELINNQNQSIDYYEKRMKRVEELLNS